MKRNYFIILTVALIAAITAFAAVSCNDEDKTQVSVALNTDMVSLVIGTQESLTATVTPNNAAPVTWISGNPEVVTVENGLVRAVGVGRTVVNARAGSSTAVCDVVVTVVPIPVERIILKKSELIMAVGDKEFLEYDFIPLETTQRKVIWSSDNNSVATVHRTTGEITAIALGVATITATTIEGGKTDKCVVNVSPDLTLLSPDDKATISLNLFNPEQKFRFTWQNFNEISEYILKFGDKPDFANLIYSVEKTESSADVFSYNLNEAIKDRVANSVPVYWTVEAKSSAFKVITKTKTLNVIPDRRAYMVLSPESATGMQITKQPGTYQYLLSTTGTASVSTGRLAKALHGDSIVLCFNYKSDAKVSSPKVSLYKSDGALQKGPISTKELPQSSEWKEWAFIIDFSLYNWGAVGDYLKLEFGSEPAKIEINGLHFRGVTKAEYVPQVFTIASNNNQTVLTRVSDTDFIIESTGTDPNVNLSPLIHGLPAGASVLTFEYMSEQTMTNRFQIYYGPGLSEARSTTDKLGTVPPAAAWTTRTYDLGADFKTHVWGAKGDWMRFDFGNVAGYKIQIRNIRFEYK